MKRRIFALLLSITIILNLNIGYTDARAEELKLYSLSAVLIDGDTGRVLYGRDEDMARPMASTTKIMTLILSLEYGNPEDMVTVSGYAAKMPDVQLGIIEGEQYKLNDLLYSMMLESHNDSAVAIAEHIGGSVDGFADMMNKKALELGLSDTYFITPNGLDATDKTGAHHTTAKDLALIMKYCIMDSPQREAFINICQTRSYTFSDYEGNRSFTVNNKNAFLDMFEGVVAGKTGFTGDAGYCYVGAVRRNDKTYIIALLGCGWPNNKSYKWSDSRTLFSYGIENFNDKAILDRNYPLENIRVNNGIEDDKISVYVDDELSMILADWEDVRYEVDMPAELEAPVYRKDVVGSLRIYINDELYGVYNIYSADEINRVNYRYYFQTVIYKFLM
ncbi:MAG: D-alanyl-D-alanine carboxypeptidase [Lachnospiraceae bacterium]|nr:D-alanyl-D-alanine carboxypeptidase [Lachnospiraceae bacterium]